MIRAIAALAASLAVSGCAASNLDRTIAHLERQVAEMEKDNSAAANAAMPGALDLPVRDHLTAVKFCAARYRYLEADERLHADALKRSGLKPGGGTAPAALSAAIPWMEIYPAVRSEPDFAIRPTAARAGVEVYVSEDTGVCAILSRGDPGAAQQVRTWLSQDWTGGRRTRDGWRAWQVRNPTFTESMVRVVEAPISAQAAKLGVTGAHVVFISGLP